jgi:hypothetical protein
VLRAPAEAAAGLIRGRSRAHRLGEVALPDAYRLLIYPDPGSAAEAAPLLALRAMVEGLVCRR